MIKFLNIFLISFSVFSSCGYKLIPKKYFNAYKKIASNRNITDFSRLNITSAYANEDEFLSEYYTKKYEKKTFCYIYFFFYENNLLCESKIQTNAPVPFSKDSALSQKSYFDQAREQINNETGDMYWTFYEIKDSLLINYDLEYEVGNWYALNLGKVVRRKFLLLNDGFILQRTYKKYKSDTNSMNRYFFRPVAFTHKPDSSKSELGCRLKYKEKNYRRLYPNNSPDKINPCDCKKN